jgi:hypothetical protein
MKKANLLFFPFFLGLLLMFYSWYLCYPLYIDTLEGFIFNRITVLYWFSLPLTLVSMFLITVTTKNRCLKWVMAVGLVMTIYSLSYFYYLIPGSDANFFRGLNEYFIATQDLDPVKSTHAYFQWPSFFILTDVTTSISGLSLANFEFLIFAVIGFLLTSALYVYTTKAFSNSGFAAVAAFFIGLFYFLNYQAVPYSLSLGSLFLLFILETRRKSINITLAEVVLFAGVSITHILVPLFFITYLLVMCILKRNRRYGNFFFLTLVIYLLIQITIAALSFGANIKLFFNLPSEYSRIIQTTITTSVTAPIDTVAQIFSRAVTIAIVIVSFIGFIFLLIRRRMRDIDKAIFLTGAIISVLGIVFYYVGSRAVPILFFTVSLGASYFIESKHKSYFTCFFLILLILFTFIPLHSSFISEIQFQTREDYQTENFMIDHYNGTKPSYVLAHIRVVTYLNAKNPNAYYEKLSSETLSRIDRYDIIVYTLGFGRRLLSYNYTADRLVGEEKLNIIYSSGSSFIAAK